jgi:hypothetical protein
MNESLVENVQTSLRPGEICDTYYYGDSNSAKSAYPCVVNTRFVQAFPNPGQGTSQFTISPNQGVSDIILQFQFGGTTQTPTANLPLGWGYSLINQVSVRYGSSAQYFFTGQQIFLQSMFDCDNSVKRDKMASLGGNALITTACIGAEANVYLNLPHNSPRADGKPLPFPSDLLVQPIIITVQLNNQSALVQNGGIWVEGAGGGNVPITGNLAVANMIVKQEIMSDSADLLARRVDMNSHAYTYPLKYFPQQMVTINLANSTTQAVNLTGFRAGEVQRILIFLTRTTTTNTNGNLYWHPVEDVVLTYNGEVFYRADNAANQLLSLVCDTKTASFATVQNTSGAWTPAWDSTWVDMPFAQVSVPYDKEVKLIHGKPILNAVVNLTFSVPSAQTDWVLNCVYLYNSSLLMSRGGSEYIF